MQSIISAAHPQFIINLGGNGTWHHIGSEFLHTQPLTWRTRCGWKYANADFLRKPIIDPTCSFKLLCEKCLPAERKARQLAQAPSTVVEVDSP